MTKNNSKGKVVQDICTSIKGVLPDGTNRVQVSPLKEILNRTDKAFKSDSSKLYTR